MANPFDGFRKLKGGKGFLAAWQDKNGAFRSVFTSKLTGKIESQEWGKINKETGQKEVYAVCEDSDHKLHIILLRQFWLLDEAEPGSVMIKVGKGYKINDEKTYHRNADGELSIVA